MNMIFKISRSKIFYKIRVLKSFAQFKLKHLRPVTAAQVFFCEFCEIFKNSFFTEHLWQLLLDFFICFTVFCNPVN